jgi:hypothetical protein
MELIYAELREQVDRKRFLQSRRVGVCALSATVAVGGGAADDDGNRDNGDHKGHEADAANTDENDDHDDQNSTAIGGSGYCRLSRQ